MERVNMPALPPVGDGKFIILNEKEWNELIGIVNNIIDVVNNHDVALSENSEVLVKHTEDLAKIASIVEEIYETI